MKIKFINPNNQKFGTVQHIENTTARTLIALGEAEEVRMPKRGDVGWLEARQEQAALSTVADSHDTPVTFVDPPQWFIKAGKSDSKPIVVKRFGFEEYCFAAPPEDCPQDVCRVFAQQANVDPAAAAEAIDAARRRQMEYDVKISTAKRW
jgi:hypothetical protein